MTTKTRGTCLIQPSSPTNALIDLKMELDPEWYAYQCKSGEVLFYYHAVTGEHRWAIHFCSCLKSRISNSTTEPCCIWEPVKSKTCESGKFVRSIGTETEDQYFTTIHRNEEIVESPRAEITFEYSVSKDRLNGDGSTESSCADSSEKPVEVFLEDPFVSSGDKQNSSKRITLKLKEISSQEFSLADNVAPGKVPRRVDDMTFPRTSPAFTKSNAAASSAKDGNVLHQANLSEKHSLVGQRKVQNTNLNQKQSSSSSSPGMYLSSVDELNNGESSMDSQQAKKQRSSASSRKNPEPRKLLKRSSSNSNKQSTEEWNDSDMQEYYDEELMSETRVSDGTEELSLGEDPVVLLGEPSASSPTAVSTKQEGEFKDDADDASDQPSICQLCGKDCTTPAMLTNHLMKHQPTGTSCPICNKYFSRRQGLRYHVQTHAGDKPHICKICNKTFTKSASLVAHYRTHSGIRPFKCPKCNKGFTHSSNLSSHLRIHSSLRPYRCNFCSKGFKTSSHLTLHLRSHSDERPYECGKCGKAFKNSSHLRSHEKLHLLPKTVFCNSCGEGFRSFSNLIYHHQTNPQCAEDDNQEHYQASPQRSQLGNISRKESKDRQPHMEEPRTHQYNSEVQRQGEEYDVTNNTLEDSSQRKRQKIYQSTSNALYNTFEHSIQEERPETDQNTPDASSNVVEHSTVGERQEIHQHTLDAFGNTGENSSQCKRKETHQSAAIIHEMEYEEQSSQQGNTKELEDELEKTNFNRRAESDL